MIEIAGWAAAALGVLVLYWLFFSGIEMSLSRGTPTLLTAAWLIWGWPLLTLVLISIASANWRVGVITLGTGVSAVLGAAIGSGAAKLRRNDRFEAALIGAFLGMAAGGTTLVQMFR